MSAEQIPAARAEEGFAQTYAEARQKFLAAAEAAGLDCQSHKHPMLGRDGEALAMDVVPGQWPPSPEVEAETRRFIEERGLRAWQAAVSAGQYTHPQGLFYGGVNPTWSHQTLRHVLQDLVRRCSRLGWIDFHTGLGPSGRGERIFAGRDDAATLARARAWWGTEVTSIYDGSSSSAPLKGLMWNAAYEEAPQAEYTGIALEYGTVPIDEVLDALRADQWLENHPEIAAPQSHTIKQHMRNAFYTDTPLWKQRVVEQALEAVGQAVDGLAAH